ncbi:hypothetical protein ACWGR4_40835 [Embleya sp. NPDC055664]
MTAKAQAWVGGVVAGAAPAGLAVSLAGARRERPASRGQSVQGSTIGGGIAQVSGAGGNVRITRRGTEPVVPPPMIRPGALPRTAPAGWLETSDEARDAWGAVPECGAPCGLRAFHRRHSIGPDPTTENRRTGLEPPGSTRRTPHPARKPIPLTTDVYALDAEWQRDAVEYGNEQRCDGALQVEGGAEVAVVEELPDPVLARRHPDRTS